jgi:hypothetical protein
LDDIGIAMRQKGDESRGVQIPGPDTAGGPGVSSADPNASKGSGKAVTPVRSDNEVLSDDDHPLQRRRSLHSDGCPVGGPTDSTVGSGGCLYATARLISNDISGGGTRYIWHCGRGGGSLKDPRRQVGHGCCYDEEGHGQCGGG